MKRTDLLTGGAKQDQQARGQVDGTVDLNNAIKVPDKTEIVPDTIKKMPDSGNEVPDTTEKRKMRFWKG